MTELVDWIKKEVARELLVSLSELKNLSREMEEGKAPKFYVGDGIEFDVMLKNMNPFPLRELDVTIHQVEAVEFDDGPIAERINNLAGGAELKVATVRGWCGKTPTMPNLPGAFSITFAE